MPRFDVHTLESAPDASKETLAAVQKKYGFVPNLLGELAEAPIALKAYLTLGELLTSTSFTTVEQQVLLIAVSAANGCTYCVAAHTPALEMAGLSDDQTDAVRHRRALSDSRLEALRAFASAVVEQRGWVTDAQAQAFLEAGYTRQQLLELFVGVAMKTLSNYVNHLAQTPIDAQFQPFAVTLERAVETGATHG